MTRTHKQILKEFNLKLTLSRSAIIDLFLNCSYALSHTSIEKQLSSAFDRVTIYRSLKTFMEKGIIHKVLDDMGKLKYALCGERCSTVKHYHNHAHFKCNQCGHTHCLDNVEIPAINLPGGYRAGTISLLIQGACSGCS